MIDLVRIDRLRVEHAGGVSVVDNLEEADFVARQLEGLVRRVEVEAWVASCDEDECGWVGNPADERPGAIDQLDYHRSEVH